MSFKNHPALLPNGLADLLPPQAENESRVVGLFMGVFARFGYQRVKPPLVEFEESLLGEGPGQSMARQTFRMMDPVSGRMMGVRADVTAQIARISASRMSDSMRPLRLSYAADVLRVNGTQLRPERQFCQVGCEMIGDDSVIADVECALVAIQALCAAGIENITIDLTVPTIVKHIYEAVGEDEDNKYVIGDLILKRDRDAIAAMGAKSSPLILALMSTEDGLDAGVKSLQAFKGHARVKDDLDRLLAVVEGLKAALDTYGLSHVQVSVDPLEHRGLEYHTGVSFSIFAKGARGELGGGGRYDITTAGRSSETATGFTLYMDTILRAAPTGVAQNVQYVAHDADWKQVKSLQDQGVQVVRQK